MIAIDLFSGAGGMSYGAEQAGIKVVQAVELDVHACATFASNFPHVPLYCGDITTYTPPRLPEKDSMVFGGPPCQGFSTSNQRTRSLDNPKNWMFREFLRVVSQAIPEWVVLENVKGLVETERGFFLNTILAELQSLGYTTNYAVLNAADFGVPQVRNRLFIVGHRFGITYQFPQATTSKHTTVHDALADLPLLPNGAATSWLPYSAPPCSEYAARLRSNLDGCENNLVSRNNPLVLERYRHIPQGGNWANIPASIMHNYKDHNRCHTGIYHRLKASQPSVVIGNFRKNMLVHPTQDRGLSVREAARIQSFPDSFVFKGSIGFQQQQVGNAVPPALAFEVLSTITH